MTGSSLRVAKRRRKKVLAGHLEIGTVVALAGAHVLLVLDQARRYSPVWHEPAQLLAAHRLVEEHDTSTYRVNGPLIRWPMGAALRQGGVMVGMSDVRIEARRSEFAEGFLAANSLGERLMTATWTARLTIIPWTLAGLLCVWSWGRSLDGPTAGLMAACLWAADPMIVSSTVLTMTRCIRSIAAEATSCSRMDTSSSSPPPSRSGLFSRR